MSCIRVGCVAIAVCFLNVTASAVAAPCANDAYRAGAGANLAECRAWERVSPQEKGGNNALTTSPLSASPDGSRVLWIPSGALGDQAGAPLQSFYASLRTSIWSTKSIDPPVAPHPTIANASVLGYSADLTKALVISTSKLSDDATDGDSNLYVRTVADDSYTLVVGAPGDAFYREAVQFNGNGRFYAASPDFGHIAFRSQQALAPGAVNSGLVQNLYQWDGGDAVALASVLPDDTPMTMGTARLQTTPPTYRHLLSEDGGRLTFNRFVSASETPIYQRVDGAATTLISRSHVTGAANPNAPVGADQPWMSPDGTRAIFSSTPPLTDSTSGALNSVYRWTSDANGGQLEDVLRGAITGNLTSTNSTGITQLQRVSEDGNLVWFYSQAALTPDAVAGRANLFVLDVAAQQLRAVTTLENGVGENAAVSPTRFSPDGHRVVLRSYSNLTGYDPANAACRDNTLAPGRCGQVYAYDADTPSQPLSCLSCGPAGQAPAGTASIGLNAGWAGDDPRPVADDGRVFFDTPESLVAADVNATNDVYQFTPGAGFSLISGGRAADRGSFFGQTSLSGDDVVFFSPDQLVPEDTDTLTDVYDARVGGGLASQQVTPTSPPSCQGSACQGSPPSQVAPITPGSSTFVPLAPPRAVTFKVGSLSRSAVAALGSKGRVSVSVRVGSAGKVAARLRARVGKKTRSIAYSSTTAKRAGVVKLTLRLSSSARRELKRKRKLKVRLTVAYSKARDASSRTFTITAPKPRSQKKGGAR